MPPKIVPIILVAGNGTRLFPITKILPKSLFPFPRNEPLIFSTLTNLYNNGFDHVVLVVSSFGGEIAKYCINQFLGQLRFTIITEETPSGTLPPIQQASLQFNNSELLVVYGDVWMGYSVFNAFVGQCFEHKESIFTVSPVIAEDCRKRGLFCCNSDKGIVKFVEKPERIPAYPFLYRNNGVFKLGHTLLGLVWRAKGCDFSKDFLGVVESLDYWNTCRIFVTEETDILDIGDIITVTMPKEFQEGGMF